MVILSPLVDSLNINQESFANSFVICKVEGKQYKVSKDDIIKLEKLDGLLAGDKIGGDQSINQKSSRM
jgi:hypothetical protein